MNTQSQAAAAPPERRVGLIHVGLTLTALWLLGGVVYLTTGGSEHLSEADVLGSFLEGAFAPLAFLWLVIGYFLQQRELSQNTEAMLRQLEEIQVQSESITASERHARLDAVLQVSNVVQHHLGSVSGFLYLSSQGAPGAGVVAEDEIAALFGDKTLNDHELFSRRLLTTHLREPDEQERFNLFYGTEVRARHSNNFIYTFERLLQLTADVDQENLIHDSLHGTGHGFLYHLMVEHRRNAPPELADIRSTGHHIRFGALPQQVAP